MIRSEFDEMMQLSMEAGTLKKPVPFESYVDERFVQAAKPASIAL
jgi:NitT/TauT family transport system substrate-binding protein